MTVGGTVFVVSYAVQRLFALGAGLPNPSALELDAWPPYYWRCALALVHAVVAIPIVGLPIDDDQGTAILRWAPLWMPAVVLPMALLMVGFP